MDLNSVLKLCEETAEIAIEYYWSEPEQSLMVDLSKFSLLTVEKMKLKDFWGLREKSELVNQLIKATMKIAKKMGFESEGTSDYQKYKNLVDKLFRQKRVRNDITFFLEPGFNFKGLFNDDKFSISKIEYDTDEIKQAKK